MEVRRTRRGTTIRLTGAETEELLQALALSVAAYGILQNFMTSTQKDLTQPAILFISRLAVATWQAREPVDDEGDGGSVVPSV